MSVKLRLCLVCAVTMPVQAAAFSSINTKTAAKIGAACAVVAVAAMVLSNGGSSSSTTTSTSTPAPAVGGGAGGGGPVGRPGPAPVAPRPAPPADTDQLLKKLQDAAAAVSQSPDEKFARLLEVLGSLDDDSVTVDLDANSDPSALACKLSQCTSATQEELLVPLQALMSGGSGASGGGPSSGSAPSIPQISSDLQPSYGDIGKIMRKDITLEQYMQTKDYKLRQSGYGAISPEDMLFADEKSDTEPE